MPSFKPSSRFLAIIASAIVLSLSATYIALAWTEPTGTMPVTVAAPLNTGGVAQTKSGALAVIGDLTASSFIDFNNNNYYVDPSGQTMLAGLQAKNPTGNLVVRFEGLSNSYSSKLYLSSISSGDGGMYYDASSNAMNLFSYGDLRFNVGTGNISGAIANQRMVITQAGNIGIGTASPSGKLQITGDASGWPLVIDAANTSNSYNTSIIKRSGQPVITWGAYPGTWNPAIQIQNEDNSRFIWLSPLGLTSGANARMRTAATGLDLYVGGTTADSGTLSMSLNSDGKVVIPGNLTVSGNICVGTSCVDVATWNKMIYAGTGGGKQKFTSSGTFTVPVGVTTIWVSISGGGGGGGEGSSRGSTRYNPGNNGSIGGTSSFGSFVSVAGGGGGYSGGNGATGGAGGSPGGYNGSPGSRGGLMSGGNGGAGGGTLSGYGFGGAGGAGENEIWCCQSSGGTGGGGGGGGATVMTQEITVSTGQVIPVTVGAGGAGATAGSPGFCLVEW